MNADDFVPLDCAPEILDALATGFSGFRASDGPPDWLVSGVWLYAAEAPFLATARLDVLADGYLARSLTIIRPQEMADEIEARLADIQGRLRGRGSDLELPPGNAVPAADPPPQWTEDACSLAVLVRIARRAAAEHRVGCGLLFTNSGERRLLVAADTSTLAMVLSEDAELIDSYCEDCEALSIEAYRALARG